MRKDPHEGAARCINSIVAQFGDRLDREDVELLEQVQKKMDAKTGTERRRREALENRMAHNAVSPDKLPELCVFEVERRGVKYRVIHNVETGKSEFVSCQGGFVRTFRLAPLETMVKRAALVEIDRDEGKVPRRARATNLASGVLDVGGYSVKWISVSETEVALKIPSMDGRFVRIPSREGMEFKNEGEPGADGYWVKDSVPGGWTCEERVYEAAAGILADREEALGTPIEARTAFAAKTADR